VLIYIREDMLKSPTGF